MGAFFEWLDARPPLYWAIAWLCFALSLLAAWTSRSSSADTRTAWRWLRHPTVFGASLLLTLCAFRWPSWFAPWALNPDEAQVIAGAITLRDHPVFWKYVDGTTHGPLNEYLLTVASLAGLPLTFYGARVMAAILLTGTLLCLWRTLRHFVSESSARLGVLPALAFWSFSWTGDYLHFSTELVAVFLLGAAAWGLATILTSDRPTLPGPLATGALLALVPLAKLQATPLALALGLGGLAALAWHRPPRWWNPAAGLVGGALLIALLLAAYLAVFGLQAQFWYSYVVSNLDYTSAKSHPLAEMPNHFFAFMTTGQSFAWFFYGCLAFVLLQARNTWQSAHPTLRGALVAGWIAFCLAYFCVIAPGRQVAHYLHFLVVPTTFLAALHLLPSGGTRGAIPFILFVTLALVPQGLNRLQAAHEQSGHLAEYQASPYSLVGQYIRDRQQAGQLLTVWGWNPQLHVETQLPQGTRESHTAFQIMPGPLRDFYRSRFLNDMIKRQPEWFVDAVGPGRFAFEHRSKDGHDAFPELVRLIEQQYVFQIELDAMRIYRRKPSSAP